MGNTAITTIRCRLVAISRAHALAGHEKPAAGTEVRIMLRGITPSFAEVWTTVTRKAPLLLEDVRRMLAHTPAITLCRKRDRALLLLGLAGAFRRSELVGLDVADITFTSEGAVARVVHSKIDQEGEGFEKAIPFGQIEDHPTCWQ